MAVGAIPSFVLMLAAFLINLKLRLGAWPWLAALVLCGLAFGGMLAAARFMRWKWW